MCGDSHWWLYRRPLGEKKSLDLHIGKLYMIGSRKLLLSSEMEVCAIFEKSDITAKTVLAFSIQITTQYCALFTASLRS